MSRDSAQNADEQIPRTKAAKTRSLDTLIRMLYLARKPQFASGENRKFLYQYLLVERLNLSNKEA